MTCVVGIADGERVHLGADSAATGDDGSRWILKDPKVWKRGSFVVGCGGSGQWWHLLRYRVRWPRLKQSQAEEAVRVKLIDALGDACEKYDVSPETGNTLIGVHGRIYVLEGELVPVRVEGDVAAIGTGAAVALGVMDALPELSPRVRMERALEIAAHRNATVAPPWRWASV